MTLVRTPLHRRGLAPLAALTAAAGVAAGGLGGAWLATTPSRPQPEIHPAQPPRGGTPDLGGMLLAGLRATPGCLGADAAQTASGRSVIIGWFEDKAAAMRWYEHPMHRRMMAGMDTGREEPPMAHVPEGIPLMVMATITPSDRPRIEGFPAPISQVSIELFTPVPGGAQINGRLSPAEFPVPHMRSLWTEGTSETGDTEAAAPAPAPAPASGADGRGRPGG